MESTQIMEVPSEVEHTLSDKWVLWAHLPHDTDWSLKSYTNLLEISSVEDITTLYNSVPDKMTKNASGGCFSFKIPNKNVVDIWKDLCYLAVGENLSTNKTFQKSINGLTISPKKSFCIIKIWLANLKFQSPRLLRKVDKLPIDGCLFKKHKSH